MREVKAGGLGWGEGVDGEGESSVSSRAAISSQENLRQQETSVRRVTQRGAGFGVVVGGGTH